MFLKKFVQCIKCNGVTFYQPIHRPNRSRRSAVPESAASATFYIRRAQQNIFGVALAFRLVTISLCIVVCCSFMYRVGHFDPPLPFLFLAVSPFPDIFHLLLAHSLSQLLSFVNPLLSLCLLLYSRKRKPSIISDMLFD